MLLTVNGCNGNSKLRDLMNQFSYSMHVLSVSCFLFVCGLKWYIHTLRFCSDFLLLQLLLNCIWTNRTGVNYALRSCVINHWEHMSVLSLSGFKWHADRPPWTTELVDCHWYFRITSSKFIQLPLHTPTIKVMWNLFSNSSNEQVFHTSTRPFTIKNLSQAHQDLLFHCFYLNKARKKISQLNRFTGFREKIGEIHYQRLAYECLRKLSVFVKEI